MDSVALRISGQGALSFLAGNSLPCLFPKKLFTGWKLGSSWGGIGSSKGFHSLNDAEEAFSAGHLLPVGLGARTCVRSTLRL